MGNTEQLKPKSTPSIAASLHERFSRLNRQLRSVELPHGMTQERMSVLAIINTQEAPVSMTVLANHERVRPATMSRMISALETDGFVKRLDNKTDRRGVLVVVTSRGRKVFERVQRLRLSKLSLALESLPSEQLELMKELTSVLEKLTSILEDTKSR